MAQRGDDDFFEQPHVRVKVEVIVVEVKDGIGDELPGPVEGDVAPAVGFDNFDAAGAEEGFTGQ